MRALVLHDCGKEKWPVLTYIPHSLSYIWPYRFGLSAGFLAVVAFGKRMIGLSYLRCDSALTIVTVNIISGLSSMGFYNTRQIL